jgi:Icc protein
MNTRPLTRREFLRGSLLVSGAALAGCSPGSASRRSRLLRVAHITDIHVDSRSRACDGMARALEHIQSQHDAPDFILNTGDSIMDALETPEEYALAHWETFTTILEDNNSLPVYHAIGNHDVWGWGLAGADAADPAYGKGMALDALGLASRYYAFDRGGWHFIVLDSTHPREIESAMPYTGKLDEEQFAWLEADLAATDPGTPVCVASHIPILCACEFFDGDLAVSGNWIVPGAWMHIDAGRLRTLFLAHPNVRLALSGHAHQHDRLEYLGVRYSCDGAICGNWWQGAYLDCPPGYVLVDLFDDGSSETEFVAYEQA